MPTDSADSEWRKLEEAAQYLKVRLKTVPRIGLITGSGLSEAMGRLDGKRSFLWKDIPHFPQATVEGHAGELAFGQLEAKGLLVQRGRVHYYEGRSMAEIVFPVRVMKLLGLQTLIVTNAAGAINESFQVGDFILIRDHINMIPDNPLRGPNLDALGLRFPNLNDAYSTELRRLARRAAESVGLSLREGVYVATPGPMYESPAEIQAYKRMGADLVGMSTVPEVIAALHCGLNILGISLVTNMAAGIAPGTKLTHKEVLETGKRREQAFATLIRAIVRAL
jgi:purine-nucleoside phosphorylase